MYWCEWSLQTGRRTGSVEAPAEAEVGTGLDVAVAVVVALMVAAAAAAVAAAEGLTSGSSCSHPGLTEVSVVPVEVQKAVHIVLAAEGSACEARKAGHTGSVAVTEGNIGIVVAGQMREEIDHSQN
jgi:hypothetical protein